MNKANTPPEPAVKVPGAQSCAPGHTRGLIAGLMQFEPGSYAVNLTVGNQLHVDGKCGRVRFSAHAGQGYFSVDELTPEQARAFAEALNRAADHCEAALAKVPA